jgi:hypothetical protein
VPAPPTLGQLCLAERTGDRADFDGIVDRLQVCTFESARSQGVMGKLLTIGEVARLTAHRGSGIRYLRGASEQELGLVRLREVVERRIGARPAALWWSYRVRAAAPAGVVVSWEPIDPALAQAVAAVLSVPTIGFAVADEAAADGLVSVRFFTPLQEIDACGHVTIALATALVELGVWNTTRASPATWPSTKASRWGGPAGSK